MTSDLFNGLTLAYIGDSCYELKIREALIKKGFTKVNDLHKHAILYTSGEKQASIINYLIENDLVTEKEIEIFKKGRNCHTNQNRKNISIQTYQKATGFEAIIGYWHLEKNFERIDELVKLAIDFIG